MRICVGTGGVPLRSLHIDCHGTLEVIDGYRATLEGKPFYGSERLYFVNLGGYGPTQLMNTKTSFFSRKMRRMQDPAP
jgi:hypothetical protein